MQLKKHTPRHPARGADIIGALGGTVAVMTFLGLAFTMIHQSNVDRDNELVARQAGAWSNAAKLYIAANYDNLLASAPTTISRTTLINSGYLNSGEPAANLYQQNWQVAVRRAPKNTKMLDAVLLSSGGQALEYKTLRYISAAIDGYGGFVYSGEMPSGCTSSESIINGAACGWNMDLSGFGISTTSGHLAVNLGADIAAGVNAGGDFLHRYAVPGREDYNQMNTALDMNGKNVNRASNITIGSDGSSSTEHGTSGSSGYIGWAKPDSSGTLDDATGLNAGLYYSSTATSSRDTETVWIKTTKNTSFEVDGKVRADTLNGTRLLQSDGYLLPGKVVTAGTSCDPTTLGISDLLADTTGIIAHSSTGEILSCQNWQWSRAEDYPIGSPIPWPSTTPPPGYFLMAGQSFPCGTNPKLAQAYPGCVLPDLRGAFIRGWDNGRGLDGGRAILSYQGDQSDMIYNTGGKLTGHHSGMPHYYSNGREVRPKNVAFNYIVKAG